MTLNSFDKKMFDKAKSVAEKSTYKYHSIGCVIVYHRRIIATAANSAKSHPMQKKYNRRYREFHITEKPIHDGAHAEILALSHIKKPMSDLLDKKNDWGAVKVYIYRISPGHKSGMGIARPCSACYAALIDKGIKHIYYTANDRFVYEEML